MRRPSQRRHLVHRSRLRQPDELRRAQGKLELKEAVYRIDRKTEKDRQGDRRNLQAERPLLFARLQKTVRRRHRRVALQEAPKNIKVWDVVDDKKLDKGQAVRLDGMTRRPKGRLGRRHSLRHRRQHLGQSPAGSATATTASTSSPPMATRIGQIVLPEICSNVCFGGPKRNRLFMTGSQSLYAVYVEAIGAHIC